MKERFLCFSGEKDLRVLKLSLGSDLGRAEMEGEAEPLEKFCESEIRILEGGGGGILDGELETER